MSTQVLIWGTVEAGQDGEAVRSRQVGDDKKHVADFRVNAGDGWFTVVAWQALADKVVENVGEGSFVVAGGKLRTRSYENRDGQKVNVTEITASSVDVISGTEGSSDDDDLPF